MFSRATIAARVKALLDKTTAAGCTEAEAAFAAEKARELLDKYALDLGEIGLEAEGTAKASTPRHKVGNILVTPRLASRIAAFCDCRSWQNSRAETVTFFGLKADVEFAVWLTVALEGHIAQSATAYLAGTGWTQRRYKYEAKKSFVHGAVTNINRRLAELTEARRRAQAAAAGTGRSLVVVKSAIVDRDFAKLGLRLGKARATRVTLGDHGAYSAGQAAGDRASFGRPVGGNGGPLAIGYRR